MNTVANPNAMQPNISGSVQPWLNSGGDPSYASPLAQQQLGRKSDHALENFEAHGLRNFNSNADSVAMR